MTAIVQRFRHNEVAVFEVSIVFGSALIEQPVERVSNLASIIDQILGIDIDSLYFAFTIGVEFEKWLSITAEGNEFAFHAFVESRQLLGYGIIQMESTQAIAIDQVISTRLIVVDRDKILTIPHIHPRREHRQKLFFVVEGFNIHAQCIITSDRIEQPIVPLRLELTDLFITDAIKEEWVGHHLFHDRHGQHTLRKVQDTILVDISLHILFAAVKAALVD